MFNDFRIDPATGDYIKTASGDIAASGDMMNNVYLSLKVKKGSDIDNPNFGMEGIPRKAVSSLPVVAREKAQAALQWLLDTGRAERIDVEAELDDSTLTPRLLLHVTAWQGGQPEGYTIYKEVA